MSVKASNTNQVLILKGIDKLSKKGLAPKPRDTGSTDLTTQATNILNACGVMVVGDFGSDFSLTDTQTDTETIANPNLASTTSKQKKQIAATDKFPCSGDSFYNLDEAPSQLIQQKNKKTRETKEPSSSVQTIAGGIVVMNTGESSSATAAVTLTPLTIFGG